MLLLECFEVRVLEENEETGEELVLVDGVGTEVLEHHVGEAGTEVVEVEVDDVEDSLPEVVLADVDLVLLLLFDDELFGVLLDLLVILHGDLSSTCLR